MSGTKAGKVLPSTCVRQILKDDQPLVSATLI